MNFFPQTELKCKLIGNYHQHYARFYFVMSLIITYTCGALLLVYNTEYVGIILAVICGFCILFGTLYIVLTNSFDKFNEFLHYKIFSRFKWYRELKDIPTDVTYGDK